jgi:uncharacterized protein (DUF427 family)
MATRLRDVLGGELDHLRFEPTAKRVRAEVDGVVVADTERAMLVWEPRRIVPGYAVPREDVRVEQRATGREQALADTGGVMLPSLSARPVWDPRVPFGVRLTDGEAFELVVPGAERTVEAFAPAEPELSDYLILDFAGCSWFEEDEPISGHPRDPFHRVDVRASSRHVQLHLDGTLLADSRRPLVVFETSLPPRYYLPPEDVVASLQPSARHTICAYKGHASYWSVDLGDRTVPDLAWCYEDPLPDAVELRGRVAFFDERVDVTVDGVARDRPVTPWSSP